MRWLRSHTRLVSCLALCGLVLQLALSFGHLHAKDMPGEDRSSPSIIASVQSDEAGAEPSDRESHDHEDEYCAIYALNALISSSVGPAPPELASPALAVRLRSEVRRDFGLSQSPHIPTRARSPPLA
jgi:hypothetical protein